MINEAAEGLLLAPSTVGGENRDLTEDGFHPAFSGQRAR